MGRSPHGDYLVLVGTDQGVREQTERVGRPPLIHHLVGPSQWHLLHRMGSAVSVARVEVRWRDAVWAWPAHDEEAALSAAATIEPMLADGRWVPPSMPQPDLPGVEREPG